MLSNSFQNYFSLVVSESALARSIQVWWLLSHWSNPKPKFKYTSF